MLSSRRRAGGSPLSKNGMISVCRRAAGAWEWEWEEANGVERKWVRAGGKNLVGESLRRFRSELCFGFFQAESLVLD